MIRYTIEHRSGIAVFVGEAGEVKTCPRFHADDYPPGTRVVLADVVGTEIKAWRRGKLATWHRTPRKGWIPRSTLLFPSKAWRAGIVLRVVEPVAKTPQGVLFPIDGARRGER